MAGGWGWQTRTWRRTSPSWTRIERSRPSFPSTLRALAAPASCACRWMLLRLISRWGKEVAKREAVAGGGTRTLTRARALTHTQDLMSAYRVLVDAKSRVALAVKTVLVLPALARLPRLAVLPRLASGCLPAACCLLLAPCCLLARVPAGDAGAVWLRSDRGNRWGRGGRRDELGGAERAQALNKRRFCGRRRRVGRGLTSGGRVFLSVCLSGASCMGAEGREGHAPAGHQVIPDHLVGVAQRTKRPSAGLTRSPCLPCCLVARRPLLLPHTGRGR